MSGYRIGPPGGGQTSEELSRQREPRTGRSTDGRLPGVVATAGSVSGAQTFADRLRAAVDLYEARRGERMSATALTRTASRLVRGLGTVPLLGAVDDGIEKVHRIDDGLAVGSAGHVADARHLVDLARRSVQAERLRYGEAPSTGATARAVADEMQEATQTGGRRPFGVALLLAGVRDGGPRLFEADPSGTPSEWRAAAVGRDADAVGGFLADGYRDDLGLDAGVELALRGLATGGGDDRTFDPAEVSVTTVDRDGVRQFGADDRTAALESAGLLTPAS
jgi:proteasome alpha subunit